MLKLLKFSQILYYLGLCVIGNSVTLALPSALYWLFLLGIIAHRGSFINIRYTYIYIWMQINRQSCILLLRQVSFS